MTTSSVSFRITRHTEDLAQTIHALSQRLVLLEQRLAVIENQMTTTEEAPTEQLASLANVDQLLRDCRELLAADPPKGGASPLVVRSSDVVPPSIAADPLADMEEAA
ncbi:MAG: hypothetical protein VKP70_01175 [Cyanobacteriota bacterium]|nr:hypothetical protein [Cyanobacteriota bacterium]